MNLATFELRLLRFSTQFMAEIRNANQDDPEQNPLDRPESEWVSAFIGWVTLIPPYEEPQPNPIPLTEPEVIPPEEENTE